MDKVFTVENNDAQTIDIEKIMAEIREELAQESLPEPDFKSVDLIMAQGTTVETSDGLKGLAVQANINCWVEIPPGNPIAAFIKRIGRKLTYWYVQAVFQRQSRFNNEAVSHMNTQASQIASLQLEIQELRNEIESLSQKLKNQQGE